MTLSQGVRQVTRVTLVLVAALAAARPASAQGASEPHRRLPGASVQIGSLRIPALAAVVDPPARPIVWRRPDAARVGLQATARRQSWMSRHPSKAGALIGLGVGAVVGAIASRDTCFINVEDTCGASSAMIFGGMGAGAGALVGLGF